MTIRFDKFKNIQNYSVGANIIGHITGEYGLGEAARCTLRAMEAVEVPFTITHDIRVEWHRNLDRSYVDVSQNNPYLINIVYTNPDPRWTATIAGYLENRYNIGVWAWELHNFPSEWKFAFDLFDEIWTYSNHSAEAISAVSPIPVVKIVPGINLPTSSLTREDLKLPKDKFIFLFIFDFHSIFERKNPLGIIEAFKQAFGKSNKGVLLVIKFSNSHAFPQKLQQLNAATEKLPSIYLIDKHLTKDEVNSLIYHCDCYVSLHRSEGFGLTMAEAMFYGKPTIATAYSSNIEFMNVGNSFMVKYDLASTPEGIGGPYKTGDIWAEPDLEQAASLMKYVFNNYDLAREIGAKAAYDMRNLFSPKATGAKIRARLEYVLREIDRINQLQTEKSWFESQVQAWIQTKDKLETEINCLQYNNQKIG
ncbi:MAG: glycosyltransferase [Limnoraphis sp. WC205]|nr:glycosyltransferase [Limnoraphis sp. WC205]